MQLKTSVLRKREMHCSRVIGVPVAHVGEHSESERELRAGCRRRGEVQHGRVARGCITAYIEVRGCWGQARQRHVVVVGVQIRRGWAADCCLVETSISAVLNNA